MENETVIDTAGSAPASPPPAAADAPAAAPAPASEAAAPETAEDAISAALGATEDAPAAAEPTKPAKAHRGAKAPKPGTDGAAAAPAPAEAAEPPQEDPYTMPEGLSERAQARFKELAGRAKDGEAWKERAEQWQQTIESTGASPEQFGQMLTYSSLVNSGDPAKMRQAMGVLEQERNAIARMLGEEAPGIDLLSDHPDLAARVQQGYMDRNSALEVARARMMAAATREQSERAQAEQMTAQTHQQAVNGLNVLGNQLSAQDPDYAAKYEAMKPIIPIIAQLPPAQWRDAFLQAYHATAVPAAPPASLQRLPASPQPLRGTGGGGGNLQQQATTAQQAIEQALGIG